MAETCLTCTNRADRLYCHLPADVLQELADVEEISHQPTGTVLFRQGRTPKGVYLLCAGQAKLSLVGDNGKSLVLKVAGPGEMLGLSASLVGQPYEVTAETTLPCKLVFVPRRDFLRFMRSHRDICLQAIQFLSDDLNLAYQRVRSLGSRKHRRGKPDFEYA